MSTTVLEALENAKTNFETLGRMGAKTNPIYLIAMEQLENGVKALENGKNPDDTIQENIFEDIDLGE